MSMAGRQVGAGLSKKPLPCKYVCTLHGDSLVQLVQALHLSTQNSIGHQRERLCSKTFNVHETNERTQKKTKRKQSAHHLVPVLV